MQSPFIHSPGIPVDTSPITKDRITVVEMVHHRPVQGGTPFTSEVKFNRELTTYEQVYERRHVAVGPEWQKLDLGWIRACGMLVILNEEGLAMRTYPTDEEKARLKTRVLEVCCGDLEHGSWLIPAGESMRAIPGDLGKLHIRCLGGKAYFTIRAFPA